MNPVFLFDQFSLRNPYYNLALEESICINLDGSKFNGGIRFWENDLAIILGIADKAEKNIQPQVIESFIRNFSEVSDSRKIVRELTYIARRCSGGGTVIHSRNENINFSLFVSVKERPDLYPVKDSYVKLLSLVQDALLKQNIQTFCLGKSDLAIYDGDVPKKISGNAQFRKKNCIAHHGTLILNKSISSHAESFLNHPPEEPDYRQKRNHGQFLASLPQSFDKVRFKKDLYQLFTDFMGYPQSSEHPPSILADKYFSRSILKNTNELINKYKNLEYILGS